ncbi:MAG: nucleotidyltransferase domain-containing protein [Colwellia sp.]|nr:nucleotidyltransferase domain-containing protein [Colwellia sp.]
MTDGLKPHHKKLIIDIISQNNHVEEITLFGSRAIHTFKQNSDIDLVLSGSNVNLSDIATIKAALEQTSLPYQVDLLIKHKIDNKNLLLHIANFGITWR